VRKNILYLHSHDTGRYIQPYGYAFSTPHLQKLAEQGVLFRQAYCAGPTCSPSRAALLTGQYPHQNGMLGLAHRGFRMKDYRHHLVQILKSAGYSCFLSGIQHELHTPQDPWRTIGYDAFLGTCDQAEKKACQFLSGNPPEPFFLSVGFIETHRPFPQVPAENARYVNVPHPLPDRPEVRVDMAGFQESVKILDRKMGLVLEALEANGLKDRTVVICTTDHGPAFPRMKCTLYDGGIGVMLIIRDGENFTGGKVIDSLISQIDILPTICQYLKIPPPEWLQGVSLLPLLSGKEEVRKEIFAQINYHAAYEPCRCIRTERYKYIKRYHSYLRPVLPNTDAGFSKSFWLRYNWNEHRLPREELYDLIFDPGETNNLVASPEVSDVLNQMRNKLKEWMKKTEDPLLEGNLPLPETARLNPQNGLDPGEPTLPAGKR